MEVFEFGLCLNLHHNLYPSCHREKMGYRTSFSQTNMYVFSTSLFPAHTEQVNFIFEFPCITSL